MPSWKKQASPIGLAARVNQAGQAVGLRLRYDNTAVIRWLKGQRPRGQVPDLICRILAARLQRPISLEDIGMGKDRVRPVGTPLPGFVERATALWRSDEQRRVCDLHMLTDMEAVARVGMGEPS